MELGRGVAPDWEGRLVFAFHPHESHFLATPDELLRLPAGLTPEAAVFFPNMETAVTFLLDGQPLMGEQVAIFGQGIVGLLLTALLSRWPLSSLVTLDLYPRRRLLSEDLGAHLSLDPSAPDALARAGRRSPGRRPLSRGGPLLRDLRQPRRPGPGHRGHRVQRPGGHRLLVRPASGPT